MVIEKYDSIIDFVAEQNRLMRTRGLPKTHPKGKLEPCDMPLTSEERRYWEEQELLSHIVIDEFNKE